MQLVGLLLESLELPEFHIGPGRRDPIKQFDIDVLILRLLSQLLNFLLFQLHFSHEFAMLLLETHNLQLVVVEVTRGCLYEPVGALRCKRLRRHINERTLQGLLRLLIDVLYLSHQIVQSKRNRINLGELVEHLLGSSRIARVTVQTSRRASVLVVCRRLVLSHLTGGRLMTHVNVKLFGLLNFCRAVCSLPLTLKLAQKEDLDLVSDIVQFEPLHHNLLTTLLQLVEAILFAYLHLVLEHLL